VLVGGLSAAELALHRHAEASPKGGAFRLADRFVVIEDNPDDAEGQNRRVAP